MKCEHPDFQSIHILLIQAALVEWLPEHLVPSEGNLRVLSSGKDLKAVQEKGLPPSKVRRMISKRYRARACHPQTCTGMRCDQKG